MFQLTFLKILVFVFPTAIQGSTLDGMFNIVTMPESMWSLKVVQTEEKYRTTMTCAILYLELKNESTDSFSLGSQGCEIGSLQRDYIEGQSGRKVYIDVNSQGPFPRVGFIGGRDSDSVIDLPNITNATKPYLFSKPTMYDGLTGLVFDKTFITCGGVHISSGLSNHTTACTRHPLGEATMYSMTPMLVGRSFFAMTTYTVRGLIRVWALGGFTGAYNAWNTETTSTTEIWDGKEWNLGPEMPMSLGFQCVVMLDDARLMLIGGVEYRPGVANLDVSGTWIYDMNNPNAGWEQKDPINFSRHDHVCGKLIWPDSDPRVIIAGGVLVDATKTDTVEIYSETSNTWTHIVASPMPMALRHSTSVVLDNAFLVLAGTDSSEIHTRLIHKYVPDAGWEELGTLAPIISNSNFRPTAFIY